MVYFDQIMHTNACQNDLNTGLCNSLFACVTAFLMDDGLLSIISAGCCQLVKMLITLELHGIFGSYFAYLFILTMSNHWYAKW